jgi:hypothetical protein
LHAAGYPPANEHFGYPAFVLQDWSDAGEVSPDRDGEVLGWRAACDCGWRSHQFHSRSRWPSAPGEVPEVINGLATGTGMFAEWSRHLNRVVPELAVVENALQVAEFTTRLNDAVRTARRAGVPWSRIGEVTGLSTHDAAQRWGGPTTTPAGRHLIAVRCRSPVQTPAPHAEIPDVLIRWVWTGCAVGGYGIAPATSSIWRNVVKH